MNDKSENDNINELNKKYMNEALIEAKKALILGEVPVGAVIVKDNKIIGRGHNLKETNKNAIYHAEICAIKSASEYLNDWRLSGCSMYVTLEPCPMCAGAIAESRVKNLYIGTFDEVMGACGSIMNVVSDFCFSHYVNVNWMYSEECSSIITDFFKKARERK